MPKPAAERVKLDKRAIDSLQPRDTEYVVWDTELPFYGLRVQPGGAKTFMLVYRAGRGRGAPMRRHRIGIVGRMTPDEARKIAKQYVARIHLGEDPAGAEMDKRRVAAEERAAPTVGDVLDRFISDHVKLNLKAKTAYEYERLVERVLRPRLGDLKARELAPKHVAEMHHAMRATRTQADHAVRVLSSAMNLAEQWGLREPGSNPCRIRKNGTRRRERLFSDIEVARLLNATDKLEAEGRITKLQALGVRLLFATGCRAGEVTSLAWRDVDLEEGVLRWPDSKTGYLVKPLTSEARDLLAAAPAEDDAVYVCSRSTKQMRVETLEEAFERVMIAADVRAEENATCHLVRHWFATKIYSDPTIPLPEQMRIVGHKSVATAMRYAHTRMDNVNAAAEASAQRRAAALKAARERLQGDNVVPIGRAGR